ARLLSFFLLSAGSKLCSKLVVNLPGMLWVKPGKKLWFAGSAAGFLGWERSWAFFAGILYIRKRVLERAICLE
ncbi:MAG: hypothetical protein ACPLQO_09795, partial [Desulfotomaculales bacterium]